MQKHTERGTGPLRTTSGSSLDQDLKDVETNLKDFIFPPESETRKTTQLIGRREVACKYLTRNHTELNGAFVLYREMIFLLRKV
jgi:hypothetical protein